MIRLESSALLLQIALMIQQGVPILERLVVPNTEHFETLALQKWFGCDTIVFPWLSCQRSANTLGLRIIAAGGRTAVRTQLVLAIHHCLHTQTIRMMNMLLNSRTPSKFSQTQHAPAAT